MNIALVRTSREATETVAISEGELEQCAACER